MPTTNRNFRIADEDYDPAMAKAKRLGVSLTDVVTSALRAYAEAPDPPPAPTAIGGRRGKWHRLGNGPELRGVSVVTACGKWTRDMTATKPLDQTAPEDRCGKCWPA